MTEKVRYERRMFIQSLNQQEEGNDVFDLMMPLEKICVESGGNNGLLNFSVSHPYNPTRYIQSIPGFDSLERQFIVRKWLIGRSNGGLSYVENQVCLAISRISLVVNVEGDAHPELLAALHWFYSNNQGYLGMPGPAVFENNFMQPK